ncbi:siphovirus Gp157 family protein [uncultured Lactobacillus sp.]|uniref:siphovirus Gp157 family protein n=1 Tax=uncultured Lactobacillus sp. TaxID=153152 RepID=UPI00260F83BF|nr:siphovirus Gp157 family protein [uncultured Lactobacillus sp.]
MNVFEINDAIDELLDKDLDPDVLVDTIESLKLTRDEKLDGAAGLSEKLSSEVDWADKKIKQLQAFKKSATNKQKSLNNYITAAIDDAGLKEIKTKHYILKPRNYRASTVVEDTMQLPVDYVTRETVIKPNKKKIYEDLKAGKKINGAYLKPNRKTVIK